MSENKPTLTQVLAELKLEYLRTFPEKLDKIRDLAKRSEFSALAEEYHKLKGTGKTYGFPDISIFSEKMELLAIAKVENRASLKDQPENLFLTATDVLLKVHQYYVAGQNYDLQQDPIAKSILALDHR